ncbi:MAG TPA: YciI family protein [Chitinophagaceae bacterium]|nr:YciI family protein [Chitinophagaceae bacterium]
MDTPQYFFTKLVPSRPSFALDMTESERAVMQEHVAYWNDLMTRNKVVVFGPVMDPRGPFGMGVIRVETEEEARSITQGDPAARILAYEIFPMRAVLPAQSG